MNRPQAAMDCPLLVSPSPGRTLVAVSSPCCGVSAGQTFDGNQQAVSNSGGGGSRRRRVDCEALQWGYRPLNRSADGGMSSPCTVRHRPLGMTVDASMRQDVLPGFALSSPGSNRTLLADSRAFDVGVRYPTPEKLPNSGVTACVSPASRRGRRRRPHVRGWFGLPHIEMPLTTWGNPSQFTNSVARAELTLKRPDLNTKSNL